MRLPNAKWPCLISLTLLVTSIVTWFVLNKLRVHWYLDAMEGRGQQSPYWYVIHFQKYLELPIKIIFVVFLILAIFELCRLLIQRDGAQSGRSG